MNVGAVEQPSHALIGIGPYPVPEAARLTGGPSQSVRRWQFGYSYRRADAEHHIEPVWQGHVPDLDGVQGLGFLDLLELRFVNAFRQHGVSWGVIRQSASRARDVFASSHPFAMRRFKTDGQRIFAEIVEEERDRRLLDLARSQFGFHQIIAPSLYADLAFSEADVPTRWYPCRPKRRIVIDPQRAFGRPIVAKEGVRRNHLEWPVAIAGMRTS